VRTYFVYILTNRSGTLYVGVTNDLIRRIAQHREKAVRGFTSRYDLDRLVYVETSSGIAEAIAREKQLKRWSRAEKVRLIEMQNPKRDDLGADILNDAGQSTARPDDGLTERGAVCAVVEH
jgi:putative endonuclease